MQSIIEKIRAELAPVTVHAHCDIPCGIYDPAGAVLAAKTVARMVELITTTEIGGPADHAGRNKVARCIAVKEQHAELVKREVQVIWSDYFKPEHLAKVPDLHDQVWKLLKLASKNKQNVDHAAAAELVAATEAFAAAFAASGSTTTMFSFDCCASASGAGPSGRAGRPRQTQADVRGDRTTTQQNPTPYIWGRSWGRNHSTSPAVSMRNH